MASIVDFDHAKPLNRDELLGWGARLQREDGLAYSEAHGGFWIASRYEDVVAALRDPDTFICAKRVTLPPQKSPVPVIPLESDEPDHKFYRSVFQPLLLPNAVAAFEVRTREIVREALAAMLARGEGDIVADFAARIPTRVMAAAFGFSEDDAAQFDSGFTELVGAAGSGNLERQQDAVDSFKAFLLAKVSERRVCPRENDLVTAILRHEVDGRRYTEDEILGLMWSAAGGAIDTTKHAIGHAVREIGIRPEIRRALIDDPGLIPVAVEESLRMNASAFMDSRYVAKNASFRGTEVKEGDRLLLVYGWANRDPSIFPNPQEMRLDRRPNRHLTFGQGIHQCVGMYLGRLEVKVALEELLAAAPSYQILAPEESPLLHGGMMWAYNRLPARMSGG